MKKVITFADRIKEMRTDLGISQYKMAELLGVSQPTIAKWEAGIIEPNLKTIKKICQILKVSSDYLIGLADF